MAAVTSSAWTDPAGATLDLATGAVLTETWSDAIASDLSYLFTHGWRNMITPVNSSIAQNITSSTTPGTDITSMTTGVISPQAKPFMIIAQLASVSETTGGVAMKLAMQKDGVVVKEVTLNEGTADTASMEMIYTETPDGSSHVWKLSAYSAAANTFSIAGSSLALQTFTAMTMGSTS